VSDELREALDDLVALTREDGGWTVRRRLAVQARIDAIVARFVAPSPEATAGWEGDPPTYTPDVPFDVQADPEAFEWRRKPTGWDEARRLRAALAALLADWDGLHSDETHCPYCGLDWYDRLFIHSDDCPVPVARAALSAAPEPTQTARVPSVSVRTRPPLMMGLGDEPVSAARDDAQQETDRLCGVLVAWEAGELSEGQACRAMGMDRVTLRTLRLAWVQRGVEAHGAALDATWPGQEVRE